jgi:integrase
MGAKVRLDKKGIYWVVTHHGGQRRKKRIGKDRKTAEEVARKIQARLVLGEGLPEREEERSVRFADFAEDWLRREVEIPIERAMKGHLAPNSARIYRMQIDVHLNKFFADHDLQKIGIAEVQGFYDHCIDTGRPRSARSIDMALNVLRLVLNHARGQGLVEINAVESWKGGRRRRRSSSAQRVKVEKVLSAEELAELLRIAMAEHSRFYPLVLFLADTGARLGEALALRWIDVDLETGTARIVRSFSSGRTLGPTKTGRERVIELSTRLRSVLFDQQPKVWPPPEGLTVFPNFSGGMLIPVYFRNRVFSKIVTKALGEGRDFSPHGLRHTWASLHMARGTPLKWIQDQGGWTTAKVLLDTYGHFMPTESRGFADTLSTAANGPSAAPGTWKEGAYATRPDKVKEESATYDGDSSTTGPRSPIMHLTDPPPFLRNSETSALSGVTPRSRTWETRRPETPFGRTRKDSRD